MTKAEQAVRAMLEAGSVVVVDPENVVIYGPRGPIVGAVANTGYRVTHLYCKGFKFNYPIHRLVYLSVHGEIPEGKEIDHIDRNKLNNSISNLRAVSRSTNLQNRAPFKHRSRLTDDDVQEIRRLAGTMSTYELARMFNTGQPNVCNIINHRARTEVPSGPIEDQDTSGGDLASTPELVAIG